MRAGVQIPFLTNIFWRNLGWPSGLRRQTQGLALLPSRESVRDFWSSYEGSGTQGEHDCVGSNIKDDNAPTASQGFAGSGKSSSHCREAVEKR
jgi:hypothetical protein